MDRLAKSAKGRFLSRAKAGTGRYRPVTFPDTVDLHSQEAAVRYDEPTAGRNRPDCLIQNVGRVSQYPVFLRKIVIVYILSLCRSDAICRGDEGSSLNSNSTRICPDMP